MALPGTNVPAAIAQLDGVRRAVRSFAWAEVTDGLPVTSTVGVAGLSHASAPSQSGLLSTADRNLHVAKHGGRDREVSGGARDGHARSYRDNPSVA
jgi:PleD family two-component response regulator